MPESPPCVRSIDGAVASRALANVARSLASAVPAMCRSRCRERAVIDRRRPAARTQ